ncbi:MAG: hypothetical protein K0Q60_1803 [Microvirga sp.]|nr:hypothetical protein [Microvirga sp.]
MKLTKAELLESIAEVFVEACRRTGREAHIPWVAM